MCNDNGKSGTVLDIDTDKYGCTVRFDDTEGTWIECDQLSKE
jgi:phage baseplate assembly protein gpV